MSEDGNCLFRAVADRVYGDPDMYDETREMCIDYMVHFYSFCLFHLSSSSIRVVSQHRY